METVWGGKVDEGNIMDHFQISLGSRGLVCFSVAVTLSVSTV
jgi:hypothetical protein